MAGNELFIQGKKFISLKRASELSGYAKDYIGQLCRCGKIKSERIGRDWFVDLEGLLCYKKNKIESTEKILQQKEIAGKIDSQNKDISSRRAIELEAIKDSWDKELFEGSAERKFTFIPRMPQWLNLRLAAKFVEPLAYGFAVILLIFGFVRYSSKAGEIYAQWVQPTGEKIASELYNIGSDVYLATIYSTGDALASFSFNASGKTVALLNKISAPEIHPVRNFYGALDFIKTYIVLTKNFASEKILAKLDLSDKLDKLAQLEIPEIKIPDIKIPEFEIPKVRFPEIVLPKINFSRFVEVSLPEINPVRNFYGALDFTKTNIVLTKNFASEKISNISNGVKLPEIALPKINLSRLRQARLPDGQGFGGQAKIVLALANVQHLVLNKVSNITFSISEFGIGAKNNLALAGSVFSSITKNIFTETKNSFALFPQNVKEIAMEFLGLPRSELAINENYNESVYQQEINSLKLELSQIKNKGLAVQSPIVQKTIVEKSVEKIILGLTSEEIDARLNEVNEKLMAQILDVKNKLAYRTDSIANATVASTYQAVALTNKIDSLSGVTINNATFTGTLGGLTDAMIPDSITASNYLLLSGGTITGALTVTATTTFNGVAYGWPSADGSANYVLSTNGAGVLSWAAQSVSSSSFWATTTNSLALYPVDTTDVVIIGGNATTTTGYVFEVIGNQLGDSITLSGGLTATGNVTGANLNISNWNNKWDLASTTIGVAYGGTGSTTLSGILKGNGTSMLATAIPGTDYEVPLTFSTGLTRSTNTITVNTSQNISTLSNLTSNGFVKTSGGTGALSIDTNTYLTGNQTITLSGAVTGSGATSILTQLATTTFDYWFNNSAGIAGNSNIATLGTIGTGVWNAGAVTSSGALTINGTGNSYIAGNLGIGTTTPNWKLQVAGTSPYFALSDTSAGTDSKHWFLSSQGGNFYIGTSTDALNATTTYMTLNPSNISLGYDAGKLTTSGSGSVFIGNYAGQANTGSANNIFIGSQAGQSAPGGNGHIFIGSKAGYSQNSSNALRNIFIGSSAGYSMNSRSDSTFVGDSVGYYTTESANSFFGSSAGYYNTTGSVNTMIGSYAGARNQTGARNVFLGYQAADAAASYTLANNNIVIGYQAGYNLGSNSSYNVLLGNRAGYGLSGSNKLYISNNQYATSTLIYGEFDNRRVGIGTTSPYANLTVWGSETSGLTAFNVVDSASTTLFSVLNTGNIGIGTTSPYAKLSVWGSGSSGLTKVFEAVDSASTTLFTILDNGRVGIGTTNPNNLLQVADLINFNNTNYGTSLGYQAGNSILSDGLYNAFLGYQAGYTATSTDSLTFIGYKAGYSQNDTGANVASSTFIGSFAGYSNTTGYKNTFIGAGAGYKNTTGYSNVYIGHNTGLLSSGYENTAIGTNAFDAITSGARNVAIGYNALGSNTSGAYNVAIGNTAMVNNTSGETNVSMGAFALDRNTSGSDNVAIGANTLYYTQTGLSNTALGAGAGYGVVSNSYNNNSLFGYRAGYGLSTGSNNILLGYQAGDNLTTGASNIIIGYDIDAPLASSANTLNIGNLLFGTGIDGTGTTLSSGNIGIGTTSPYAKLSVVGQAVAEYFTATTTSINTFPNLTATNATTTSFGINSETFTDLTGTGLTNTGGALTLNATGDWTGTIDGNNFAGGAIGAGELLYGASAGSIAELAAGTAGYVLMSGGAGAPSWVATSTLSTITGILSLDKGGTNANLTAVNGGIVYSGASALSISVAGTSGQALISGGAGSPTWFAPTAGSVLFAGTSGILQQNNSKFFWDNTNNRLGIGTSTPQASLHIGTASTSNLTNLTNSLFVSGELEVGETAYLGPMEFSANSGVISWIDMPVTSAASINTAESYSARIDGTNILTVYAESDGAGGIQNSRVGIGTTSPNNILGIYSTTKSAIGFSGASGDTYKWTMGMDVSNGGRFSIASSTALGTTDRLVILGNGNIGIGTSSPQALLTVGSSTPAYLLAGDKYNSLYVSGLFETGGTGTSTMAGNLYVMGTLRATNSYVGDLYFANNFRFTESEPLDEYPRTLILKNQDGEDILIIDEDGNLQISGQFTQASSSADEVGDEDTSVISESLAWILEQFNSIGIYISKGVIQAKEFIADKITAKKVVTDALEMKDSVTGETYCVRISDGEWNKFRGTCGEISSQTESVPKPEATPEPAPAPELIPEPESELAPESVLEPTPEPEVVPEPEIPAEQLTLESEPEPEVVPAATTTPATQ